MKNSASAEDPDRLTVAVIEARHRRWTAWDADSGTWCASVRRNLTKTQQLAGCMPYLQADTPGELEQLLAEDDAKSPDPWTIPVRIAAWGSTVQDTASAINLALADSSRQQWQAVEVQHATGGACGLDVADDGRALAAQGGEKWAYVVYPDRAAGARGQAAADA